ncbi:hypothetical protein F7725_003761 [Dissostichus mawsoni]|uniref:Uncharacterized protein n=1 Tax=Dissostichus mawsoni TaxID=36200 RepID=A0A7J5YC38_DISMA|nr:hypothetical protein F7725_003761 [Dissostichus mawsoni]
MTLFTTEHMDGGAPTQPYPSNSPVGETTETSETYQSPPFTENNAAPTYQGPVPVCTWDTWQSSSAATLAALLGVCQAFFFLFFLSPPPGDRLPLQRPAVALHRQELLLLPGVREQHQQLVEDAVEVVPEQLLTAAVVLHR